jgi:HEXXH motif-containing protein
MTIDLRVAPHRLSDAELVALGAGRPGPGTLRELRKSQVSRHMLLLREIAAAAGPGHLDALLEAEAEYPERVHEAISQPLFGAWASACLSSLGT